MSEKDCKNCVHYEEEYNARKSERYGTCLSDKAIFSVADNERQLGSCKIEAVNFELKTAPKLKAKTQFYLVVNTNVEKI